MHDNSLSILWEKDIANILNSIQVGLLIVDKNGILLFGNRYYTRLTELDLNRYIGHHINEIAGNKEVLLPSNQVPTMFDRIKTSRQPLTENMIYRTDDLITTTAFPVFSNENELQYVVYTQENYSNATHIQNELQKASEKLDALEEELRSQIDRQLAALDITVRNPAMRDLYSMAARVAGFPVAILLTGETGVGKDVMARFIHAASNRSKEKFIAINAAAIPSSLFESELFGYAPGAFTGASKSGKVGLIQLADQGTFFLDEIGELPLDMQAKLLQVLQDRTIQRIGSDKVEPVDIRIIAATNRNLEQMVQDGKFRMDLYYRLNAIQLHIPPLRKRTEDLSLLTLRFLKECNQKFGVKKRFSPKLLYVLEKYSWPGNIRELQHVVENIVLTSENDLVTPLNLPKEIYDETLAYHLDDSAELTDLKTATENLEKKMISFALKRCHTNSAAAQDLGISSALLIRKRKKYSL